MNGVRNEEISKDASRVDGEFASQVKASLTWLRPFAHKLTRNWEETQDLVQDTMLKALVNHRKFSKGTNLKGWLITIMKHTFINQRQRRKAIPAGKSLSFLDELSRSSENMAYSNLGILDIQNALRAVPEANRQAILLFLEGYKYEEISEYQSVSIGTVKVRIHRARKALQQLLVR